MDEEIVAKRRKCVIPGIRYLFALNGFLGFFTLYAIRVNINVAIVAMVNGTAMYKHNNESLSDECEVPPVPFSSNTSSYDKPEDGEFLWSPKIQGVVLGAFYYGYCISQIPGGRLSELYSGKWVFGIGTVVTAILTLLTPLAAHTHVGLLIAVRALEGLSQGVTFPAMSSMLGRWLPDSEKGVINTIVHIGINFGTITSMTLSGALCKSYWFGGWPSAFYVVGVIGCIWFIVWCLLVTDSPHTHPFISDKELKYITSNQTIDHNSELPPIPWIKILTSIPFWAVIVTQIGQDWCFYIIMTELPTYFSTILHFDIQKSGILAALPYFLTALVGLVIAFTADIIVRKEMASLNFVRKFCNSVSGFGRVLGLIGVCLAGCNSIMTIAFFMFTLGIEGFGYVGCVLSFLDLSPEFAGTLIGISNTISNLTGFLAPLVVGALTEKYQTLHQWRIVFVITCIVLAIESLVFIFFATTKKQDWAKRNTESNSESENEKKRTKKPFRAPKGYEPFQN